MWGDVNDAGERAELRKTAKLMRGIAARASLKKKRAAAAALLVGVLVSSVRN
jgi:hypothetical protein